MDCTPDNRANQRKRPYSEDNININATKIKFKIQ